MTKRIFIVLTVSCLFVLSGCFNGTPENEETRLWPLFRLTKGENVIYILGTMSYGDERSKPLPKVVEEIIDDSDVFATGIDIYGATEYPLPTIKNITARVKQLTPSSQETLRNLANEFGKSYDAFLKFTNIELLVLPYQTESPVSITNSNWSSVYQKIAARPTAPFHELTNFKTAMQTVYDTNKINPNKVIEELKSKVDMIVDFEVELDEYHNGQLFYKDLSEFDELYLVPIYQMESKTWIPKILELHSKSKQTFIFVDMMYMKMPHGLLSQLEDQGFLVEEIPLNLPLSLK